MAKAKTKATVAVKDKSKTSPVADTKRKKVKVEKRKITQLFIHCAATKNGKAYNAEAIDAMHKDRFNRKSKYKDTFNAELKHIGYHFIIYIDGSIATGRHLEEIGAHVKKHNTNSVGVCLIGTNAFTILQWNALKSKMAELESLYPDATIHGHREYANKDCPGFDVQTWLKNDRKPEKKHVFVPPKTNGDATAGEKEKRAEANTADEQRTR